MSRIAFFTEKLPPDADPVSVFSYDLIRSLADQSHEIRLFSTYREGVELPESHPRIEIVRPFKYWGWLELPRLLPLLFDFRPDVIHFIQPRAEALKGFTNAMSVIPGLGPVLGKPAVVTSFYDFNERDILLHKALLAASDVVTVSNEPQKRLLEKSKINSKCEIVVLPLPGALGHRAETSARQTEPWPDALLGREIIFVPGNVSEHIHPEKLLRELAMVLKLQPNAALAIGGGWGTVGTRERHRLMRFFSESGVGSRFLLTGPLDFASERQALQSARIVFLASLPPESMGLARIMRDAMEVSAALVLSDEQARIDALHWRDSENALITTEANWAATIQGALGNEALLERIRARLPEFTRLEVVDRPGNVVSRIYAQILDQRRLN